MRVNREMAKRRILSLKLTSNGARYRAAISGGNE